METNESFLNHLIFQANEKLHKVASFPQEEFTGKLAKRQTKDKARLCFKFKHVLKPSTVRFQSRPTKRYTKME